MFYGEDQAFGDQINNKLREGEVLLGQESEVDLTVKVKLAFLEHRR